ncbi:MAG: T9SS type A sorting domain-containing protein, partial [Bacteroidetes bacterium]|nr:T9SS type A sorting domain-containing protein [Bacteroidota bacterium]
YNVEYSSNNGSTWTTLASNISGNSYNWTNIPNNPTSTYLVRVSDNANTCKNDVSDATFTVTPAQPVLITPNGGEQLWSGNTYTITWRQNSFYSNVRLEYSLDNGTTWTVITTSATNSGSYSWTLPNANSTTCLVKASNTANVSLNDVSDAVFTIKPAVRVFTPNGYDVLGACTQTSITFDHSPAYTNFNIEYSTNGGSTWNTLVTNQAFSGTSGTYSWTVPNIPTTTALVRVYPYNYTSLADQSDTTFTIKKAVQIIQPNYGGVLQVGTTYPIIWSSDGISNLYDIAYSTNGGSTWTNIVIGYNTSTNTYNWTVPNIPSTNCLIRIRDNINSCKQDISQIPFTISTSASPITVTRSNGLDTLYGCQNYNITWTESGAPLGSYTISYSPDGGSTWNAIVSGYATTGGSYAWVVPNINTTTALIRVAASGNSNIFDLSDASFSIISRSVRATPDTTICGGNQVQLLATGGTGTYTWTPSASLNNANIANPVASPATTTSYIVSSGNGTCQIRDTAVVTVLTGGSTAVGVSISASPSASACSGSPVTFTATPTNGGTIPSYQWKKNGVNVGLNSPTYILSTPANNDVITCVLTSNAACATNNPATSNAVTITIFGSVTPSVTIATAATTVCGGQSVTFTATPVNGGNSPAYQWMINGVNAGTNSATFTTTALNNNDIVTCQLTSNAACASSTNVSSNAILMTVTPNVVPSVSITTPATTVCSGQSVTFTATHVNGGSNPSYQWKVNGVNAGTNSATFTTSTLANNAQVTCVLTSNATCASPASATSAAITMTVTGSIAPSVTVSASSTSICAGQSATFTATPANGGATPTYQWYVNGTPQGGTSTFTSGSLSNNDTIRVVMTSSSGCASPASATSAPTVMTVNPVIAPTVSISSTATSICSGTQVTFTATAINAGTNPSYQWKVNGTNAGGNSATYISSALANNDTVYCIVTSASSCASPNNATSNRIGMTVTPYVTPSVTISASSNSICSGNSVIFTATASNGGSTPVYQWKLNGNNVGSNSASYASTSLANGDVVTCVLTSTATCASPASTTSNAITMSVGSSAPAAISITASATAICSGTQVTFTATTTNGGIAPAYQWKVNGNNAGSNSATFTSATLSNNDVVTCQLTSSSVCANPTTASSNAISVTVSPGATPSVSIAASATTICSGTSVTFTATPVNGGTAPVYQWQVNGINAGTNSPTFTTTTLTNNAQVTCILTSNAACLSTTTATSTPVTITVTSSVVPAVSISASSTSICAGQSATFTATPVNGGTTPAYQWYVNGTAQAGGSTFTSASLNNSDTVRVVMTSSSGCASPAAATSAPVVMTVNPTSAPSVSISTAFTTVCSGTQVIFTATATSAGSSPTYQWKVNGTNAGTNSSTFTTFSLVNGDTVSCVVTSASVCASPNSATSNKLRITVVQNVTPSVSISTTSNSICSGNNVIFTATPVNGGTAPTYQWKVNGNNVGTNSASYASGTLANNDVVSCVMTSNAPCATPASAASNSITMTVGSAAAAGVSISASSTTICGGAPVTFTATPANGGSNPAYQWKVNGINAGSNSATFTSATLNNNDVVTCQITSSSACASPATGTSNAITISAGTAVTPAVSIAASAMAVCSGSSVTFTATPTNGGSTPSYQWKVNGLNAGTNNATFTTTTLSNNDVVSCVLTTSAACATTTTAASNSITITITPTVAPAVSVSASATTICVGTQVIFTAAATNGGGAPAYQWKVNGINAGTNSATFATTTLSNNDVVSCVLTSSAACASPASVSSNSVTMTVQSVVAPSVSIGASSTSICSGPVTFTATPVNGGSTPSYQWKVNGSNAGTNSSTFTTSSLASGDIVSCTLTSAVPCASPASAVSNQITMTGSAAQPSVSIASASGSICAGSTATFTATVTHPGSSQTYQWMVNGINTGTNSSSFSSAALNNNDTVTCQVTVTGSCVGTGIATSNRIVVSITPTVTPAISITASQTSICSGTAVTFTATATNGGSNPVYQWKVNGANTGTNSSQFISSILGQNDTVTCTLASSATCAVPAQVISNPVVISVTTSVIPSVSVAASPAAICQGTPVTFTAMPVNGGANPTYIWYVNGSSTGTNSATYTSSSLSTGSTVSCRLVSSASCAVPDTIGSNIITVTVSAPVTPAVTITNTSGTVCAGTAVNFTATATNGGNAPTYQWYVNGNPVGTSSAIFSSATLANGDLVSCRLTSNAACVTTATALSNNVTVTITPQVTPTVSISTATTTICQGSSLTFTATATNGGTTPVYQWFVNGLAAGTNSSIFTTTTLQNGSVVTCKLTSNAGCTTASLVTSNAITVTVGSGTQPTVTIAVIADTICAGSAAGFTATALNAGTSPIYQWKVNGINAGTNSSTFTSTALNNNDQVTVSVMSTSACSSGTIVASAPKTIHVLSPVTPAVSISASDTTICAGSNVTFTATAANSSSPFYQWMVNGINTGTNAPTYTSSSISNNDVVTVRITTSGRCLSSTTATSAGVTMVVNPVVTASVSISAVPSDTICEGTQVAFTATAVNGGTTPAWQWQVNGANTGTNTISFYSSSLSDGDIISVQMTSSALCVAQPVVSAAPVAMVVHSLPAVPVISRVNNVLTSSAPAGDQWYAGSHPISGATASSYTVNATGWYSVAVTNQYGCSSRSDSVQVVYTAIDDVSLSSDVTILPNPFAEKFTIAIAGDAIDQAQWSANITDVEGRLIEVVALSANNVIIDLSERASGVYFVNIYDGLHHKVFKVLKVN